MSKAEFKSPPIADFHATKFTWKAIRVCTGNPIRID